MPPITRSRTRLQPATPLAEIVDSSPRRRVLGTVNGNAQPLPSAKALSKAPTEAPTKEEPPTLVSAMSIDVLSLTFELMDDGRGPLSLAVRQAAGGLSSSCHTIHSVAKEPLAKMHTSFDSLQKDASHFCVRVGGGTSTWLCQQRQVLQPKPSPLLAPASASSRKSLEPPPASTVLPPAQIEGGCRLLTCLDLGRLARVIASGAMRGQLVALSLESNLFGNAGCELLASGLLARAPGGGPALPTLAELELKDNQIGGSGTASLARAFAAVPGLRYLGLADNRVDDVGVSAIALGAAALPRLVALDLSLNHRVAAQGMRALTKALAAGAWPHMPTHPRRDPRGKAGEGRLRAGFGVPPLDDEGLRDELLVALDARQQAAVARQEAAAI